MEGVDERDTRVSATCYYTCSLVPPSLLAAAGHRLQRLMPGDRPASPKDSLLTPHPLTCPYVSRLLPLAEEALSAPRQDLLVVPSGCDAMRRCGDLLAAAFPEQVYRLSVPRTAGETAAKRLARDLGELAAWLQERAPELPDGNGRAAGGPHRASAGAEGGLSAQAVVLPAPRPGGVFLVSGPQDSSALAELLVELGTHLSGLESCSAPHRAALLAALDASGNLEELARHLLAEVVCPRRPAADRQGYLTGLWAEAQPAAVIYARQSFCDPGAYDALAVGRLASERQLPFLEVEVDLPLEITGPLRTRIEAFLETLLLDL